MHMMNISAYALEIEQVNEAAFALGDARRHEGLNQLPLCFCGRDLVEIEGISSCKILISSVDF